MIPWYDFLACVSSENCANDNLCRNTVEGLRGRHKNWYTRQKTVMTPFCRFLTYHRIGGGYDKPIVMNRPWATKGSSLGWSTSHLQIYFCRNALLEETTRIGMLGRKSSGISTRLRKCTSPTFGLATDHASVIPWHVFPRKTVPTTIFVEKQWRVCGAGIRIDIPGKGPL